MFEQSLVESSGRLRLRSGRYLWITGTFNVAVIVGVALLPLLYPEALPRTALAAMLTAPPPPLSPQMVQRPADAPKATRSVAPMDAFTAPAKVPRTIESAHDDAPPPLSATGIVGMDAVAANCTGPVGAFGFGAPPVAVVKVLPPRVATAPHISGGVIAGNKLSGSSPAYPAIAKAAHVSGTVILHAVISRAGQIQSLSVISGPEMLRASAVAAVQDWRYRPYLLNGAPTDVETTITVNFSFGG